MRWLILLLLVLYSIVDLYLLRVFCKDKQKIAQKSAISSLVFIWLIYLIDRIFIFQLPELAYFLVLLSFFFNEYFGYYRNLFNRTKKYDRFQHAFGCFSFAIFLYFLLSNIVDYGGSKTFQALYVFLLGIFSGVYTEILEFLHDLKHEEKMQKGLRDTNVDLIFDVIGSVLAAICAFLFLIK
jgi:VanZ family protein